MVIAAAVLCIAATWFFARWNFANAISSHLDLQKAESKIIAQWLADMAPNDPQTHFANALILEKTFDAGDLSRSLSEYETAAALSPHNYVAWLNLGKSRSLNGDSDGAETAFQRALELAPNYATVLWIYGNALVRQGKTAEGFGMIAKAAAANPDYSRTAAVTALQVFDSDVGQARTALGDSDVTNAAFASALAGQTQFDAAYESWARIGADARAGKYQKFGETLAGQMAAAKKFRLASRATADITPDDAGKPLVGQINNSGFERGVKLSGAGTFDWQIADGAEPQIGLSESQRHSGKYGLFILFNTFQTVGFRSVSQTVAVEPGATYEFELFYRSDVKTSATLKWEIADAANATAIASTNGLVPAADWTSAKAKFTVPAGSDGVIIRLAREGCIGPACQMNGRIAFDDFSLRRL